YHLPAFAGVGLSQNDFRWSPRIDRQDGLLRIVPGLGTRAADRVGDDYPVLVAPGKPGRRVNTTPGERERYAQRRRDDTKPEPRPSVRRELAPQQGTRALNVGGDVYPVHVAAGKLVLRGKPTPWEPERYAQRKIDVINLETGQFETESVEDLLREHGRDYPIA